MSDDGRGTAKRQWKAFQVNYDFVFSASERVCSYCLSDQDIAALMSVVEYFKWHTRWVSAGAIDTDKIDAFASGLEYRLMSGCCDDNLPIQYRYSPAGILERSMNGGGVWESAALYDPRVYSPTFPDLPGADGTDKKCLAATGAAALVKSLVDEQITDDMTHITLTEAIESWVKTMIETSNPFTALLTFVSNSIFALIISALRSALTDPVYETFKCILLTRMAADASVNDASWTLIRSDITSQIAGIAGVFLEHIIYLLGTKGTTNLLRAGGAAEGDCDCPTNCNADLWTVAAGDVVFRDECTIVITPRTADSRISLTTGSAAICGYYSIVGTGAPSLNSVWLCGSGSPSANINHEAVLNWNYDSGNFTNGVEYTFTFHNEPVFP